MTLETRFALYRHIVRVHHRKFCLYCEFEEARPSKMLQHVHDVHPSVRVDALVRFWRSETEMIQAVPVS